MIGNKAKNLLYLENDQKINVPKFVILSSDYYWDFINENHLKNKINYEVYRKSFSLLRWEEKWDCAFRIKNLFLNSNISNSTKIKLDKLISQNKINFPVIVRSSSECEDSDKLSFAGIFESVSNCLNIEDIKNAIIKVYSSLWSDKTLLFKDELNLDVEKSFMSIIIQEQIISHYSGVTFSTNPNHNGTNIMIVEVCPGGDFQKQNIITLYFDKKKMNITSNGIYYDNSVYDSNYIQNICSLLKKHIKLFNYIEQKFKIPMDIEWVIKDEQIYVVQARPITNQNKLTNDKTEIIDLSCMSEETKRSWYLTLTLKRGELFKLYDEIRTIIIPDLKKTGELFSSIELSKYNDNDLVREFYKRIKTIEKWRILYVKKLIPFAHGVREFATYYSEIIKPKDFYEFITLLESKPRISSYRRSSIYKLSLLINSDLYELIKEFLCSKSKSLNNKYIAEFKNKFNIFYLSYIKLKEDYFDISFEHERWTDRDDIILKIVLNYKENPEKFSISKINKDLLRNYFRLANNFDEAYKLLKVGRLSWQIRDDDNLLLSKIESQLISAFNEIKLRYQNKKSEIFKNAISDMYKYQGNSLVPSTTNKKKSETKNHEIIVGRQLRGQPAVAGLNHGYARIIENFEDLKKFQVGEIIVCEAIDPTMTQIIPFCNGVIEQRGGMLIHGVIIARELKIPCVTGVHKLDSFINNGDYLTIDGDVGLVINHGNKINI